MSEWMAAHPRARAVVLVTAGLVAGLVLLAFILAGVDRVSSSTTGEPDTDSPPTSPVQSPASDEQSPTVPATPAQLEAALADLQTAMATHHNDTNGEAK